MEGLREHLKAADLACKEGNGGRAYLSGLEANPAGGTESIEPGWNDRKLNLNYFAGGSIA